MIERNKTPQNKAGSPREQEEATPPSWPSVTLLLLNWNGRDVLEMCLPSLAELDYPTYRIVMIDNASEDDSVAFVGSRFPQVKIIRNEENLGFSRAMNVGLRQADGDIVVLLNNDVLVRPDWLKALVRPLTADETIGITGCKLLFPDGVTLQHCGARLEYPLAYSHHYHYRETDEGQADEAREVDYVTGASMAIARRVLEAIGLLDERFSPIYFEEADYCYRARAAGYRVLYTPHAVAIHHESLTMRRVSRFHLYCFHMNRIRFVLKHYKTPQFFDDFVPAEIERLKKPSTADEIGVIRQVFLEVMIGLPRSLRQRGDEALLTHFQEAFDQLRQAALSRRPAIHLPSENEMQAELAERQEIQELAFTSDSPLFGPLIATLRRAWNSVAAKWAVRSVIQQQNSFNKLVTRLLAEQDKQVEDNASETTLLARELLASQRHLDEAVFAVNRHLEELNRRIERLEEMMSSSEGKHEESLTQAKARESGDGA